MADQVVTFSSTSSLLSARGFATSSTRSFRQRGDTEIDTDSETRLCECEDHEDAGVRLDPD